MRGRFALASFFRWTAPPLSLRRGTARLARRADAVPLLDEGWSCEQCEQVAKALYLDDDKVRGWAKLCGEGGASHLSQAQEEALKAWIAATLPRSTREVGAYIERRSASSRPRRTISQPDFHPIIGPFSLHQLVRTDLPCSRQSPWLHAGGTNPGSASGRSLNRGVRFRLPLNQKTRHFTSYELTSLHVLATTSTLWPAKRRSFRQYWHG